MFVTMDNPTTPPKDQEAGDKSSVKPANQRAMARLSAVQALYQMDVSGQGLTKILDEFMQFRLGREVDEEQYLPSDPGWFKIVVSGVVDHQRTLDPHIHAALKEGWPLKRIDLTLRALLRAGAFELIERQDVPARVVINEYVEVAKGFFFEDEPRIVNGVLDKLARAHRASEFEPAAGS